MSGELIKGPLQIDAAAPLLDLPDGHQLSLRHAGKIQPGEGEAVDALKAPPEFRHEVGGRLEGRLDLLLGATAVRHLIPGKRKFTMRDEVGRVFTSPEHPGAEIMILYHPAYLLRDPRRQPRFVEHVEHLWRHLDR